MATININFDIKSIKNAIKQVETIKRKLQKEVPSLFIDKCLEWVRVRANEYLSNINMSGNITSDIQNSWYIETITSNAKRLVNNSDKAVYVEFGVGQVAQGNPHPNSNETNYEYNIQNGKKDYQGRWRFRVNEKNGIDLVEGNYSQDNDLIITTGSPANLYLYNSAMDLISTGTYKTLWQEAVNETI